MSCSIAFVFARQRGNVYRIASYTKLFTGIACMQLAKSVAIALDDPELVERICPELRDIQVLQKVFTIDTEETPNHLTHVAHAYR
jgi:hypothetical protein